ncbi:MAG: SMC-Scp complex subunit ScpB [Ruminococcaceae bacterium]|nr:SMC-Scp complex subunit ScpB [Oscillospiraceae bacterium]
MTRELECKTEAVLFGAGESVTVAELAHALEIEVPAARQIVVRLAEQYERESRGLKIITLGDAFQMCTREEYAECVRKVTEPKRRRGLSSSALETLSVIAYNQPITKSRIEMIRGVDSSYSVLKLTERGLIDEAGRLDAPGRPILYVTTEEFLRCFGLTSLEALPQVNNENNAEENGTE